jgi:hypothetical protein
LPRLADNNQKTHAQKALELEGYLHWIIYPENLPWLEYRAPKILFREAPLSNNPLQD